MPERTENRLLPPAQIPFAYPERAVLPFGSGRVNPEVVATPKNGKSTLVITDARMLNGMPGIHATLLGILPEQTPLEAVWDRVNPNRTQSHQALHNLLSEITTNNKTAFLLSGGEHIDRKTTVDKRYVDLKQASKYGKTDIFRDNVGLALLTSAEKTDSPIIAFCRGSQLALYYFSGERVKPSDHNQKQHHHEIHPDGPMLRQHRVKNELPEEVKNALTMALPEIIVVNSAHAQGFTRRDIDDDDETMKVLNSKGWYPWLVAPSSTENPLDEVYEAWIRVSPDDNAPGKLKITGVMTQFHPELPNDKNDPIVKQFIKDVLLTNLQVPSTL